MRGESRLVQRELYLQARAAGQGILYALNFLLYADPAIGRAISRGIRLIAPHEGMRRCSLRSA
jgi:hypothetical protein